MDNHEIVIRGNIFLVIYALKYFKGIDTEIIVEAKDFDSTLEKLILTYTVKLVLLGFCLPYFIGICY